MNKARQMHSISQDPSAKSMKDSLVRITATHNEIAERMIILKTQMIENNSNKNILNELNELRGQLNFIGWIFNIDEAYMSLNAKDRHRKYFEPIRSQLDYLDHELIEMISFKPREKWINNISPRKTEDQCPL